MPSLNPPQTLHSLLAGECTAMPVTEMNRYVDTLLREAQSNKTDLRDLLVGTLSLLSDVIDTLKSQEQHENHRG